MQSRAISGAAAALALWSAQGSAFGAEDLVVRAERQGESVEVRAQAVVDASPALVWSVLTDYADLPQFIPGISRSIVRKRDGNHLVVEQSGEAHFLFFSFPVEVTYDVVQEPYAWVVSRAISGNLRRMRGRYDLEAEAGGRTCFLRYEGEIEPDFSLPPLFGTAALRGMAQAQFAAMVEEIERRAASGPAAREKAKLP